MKHEKRMHIIFIICLLVLIAALSAAVFYKIRQNRRTAAYEDLASEVAVVQEEEPDIEEEEEEEPEPEETTPEIPVDFELLWEQNPDIYAWIHIEDTQVDYPILHSEDNEDYYLDHTVDGESGLPGSIYTQYSYNQSFETDNVTVIYGHNMRNDSMFGGLSEYLDEDYREAHSEIQIYTPEHIYTYTIVCAVTYDNRHILAYFNNCTLEEDYGNFLESLQSERQLPSWLADPLGVTTEDRMIILSTCNDNSSQRFLIGAVLTDEE